MSVRSLTTLAVERHARPAVGEGRHDVLISAIPSEVLRVVPLCGDSDRGTRIGVTTSARLGGSAAMTRSPRPACSSCFY